jgi:SAM-dependent methyltransferase
MDVRTYNRTAWNRQVESGNEWTVPVGPDVVTAARQGHWQVLLTPTVPVPHRWFPPMPGCDVLCLASGGGQQGPVFAAAGANVTVLDNSPRQLEQDRLVAERDGLAITTIEGDMADLSMFPDDSFDLVFHPVSNVFAAAVRPVWIEVARVLRRGGVLLAGIMNPVVYIFDTDLAEEKGILEVRYRLPYSDLNSKSPEALQRQIGQGWPLEFSHSLEDQIGGQTDAGLLIAGLYEDTYPPKDPYPLAKYMPMFIATRAIKP